MKTKIFAAAVAALSLLQAPVFCAPPAPKKSPAAPAKKAAAVQKPAPVKPAPAKPAEAVQPAAAAVPAAAPAPEKDLFAEAVENIKAKDEAPRRQAALFLAQSRDPRAVPYLQEALGDAVAQVRKAAVEGLGLLSRRELSGKIAELLVADGDQTVRHQAAITLGYLGDPAAGPALVKALEDQAKPVRFAAIHTLGILKYEPAEDALIGFLSGGDANAVRLAIGALGKLQSEKSLKAIARALESKDQYARREAARALGEIGSKAPAEALKKALAAETAPAVKAELALALSRLGFPDGIPAARALSESKDLSVKSQALNALVAASDFDSIPKLTELFKAETDMSAKHALELAIQNLKDAKAAGAANK